jgi:hypothetical protein
MMAIDAQEPRVIALWRVGGLDGPVLAIGHDPGTVTFVLLGPAGLESFRYELSADGAVLRKRTPMHEASELDLQGAHICAGSGVAIAAPANKRGQHDLLVYGASIMLQRGRTGMVCDIDFSNALTLVVAYDHGVGIERLDVRTLGLIARLELRGASRACFRPLPTRLGRAAAVIADDRGRLLTVDEGLSIMSSLRV